MIGLCQLIRVSVSGAMCDGMVGESLNLDDRRDPPFR